MEDLVEIHQEGTRCAALSRIFPKQPLFTFYF